MFIHCVLLFLISQKLIIMKKFTFVLFIFILLLNACSSSEKENSPDKETVFIENESGQLEQQEVVISDDDTVQVENLKTGEWEKMTKKEADEIINESK